MKIVRAYRGRTVVYRSEFSHDAKLDGLVQAWRDAGCRVIVQRIDR
jgi:hypothetical protein